MELHRTFTVTLAVDGRSFLVLRADLREALGEVGALDASVSLSSGVLPRPGELIGKEALFAVAVSDGSQDRKMAGKITRATLRPDRDDVPVLDLEVRSVMWELKKRASSRIFQKMSVVDVAKKVLTDAGITSKAQDWRAKDKHPTRDYIAQNRETDLDFLARLFAEEGIYFTSQVNKDDAEVVIFADDPKGLGKVHGATTLDYFETMGADGPADRVLRLTRAASVRSDKTYVRDYDPAQPRVLVEGDAEGKDEGAHALEVYEWPARTTVADDAKRRAGVLLDSIQAERDILRGETSSLALWPGLRFSIDGHPYEPMNEEYLATGSRFVLSRSRNGELGSERGQEMRIELTAAPAKTTRFRPPRRARERTIAGTETAFTTGASGEEIWVDDQGRVKVGYHWDRSGITDDQSSLWIRTLQGHNGGSMLLPRVGWEVSVRHQDGDVDRPLVLGRMYNPLAPPPYSLPGANVRSGLQTATSPGGGSSNELRMDDTAGKEEVFMNASKDMTCDVVNNVTESVGHDLTRKIGSNQKHNVTNSVTSVIGSNDSLSVAGNQSIAVETYLNEQIGGNDSLSIGGNRNRKIGGDHRRDVAGDDSLAVGANEVDLVVGKYTDNTLGSYDHQVGAALVELSVGDRTVKAGGNITEKIGGAKIIAVKGGRGVEAGGSVNQKVGGGIINIAKSDRSDKAGAAFTEVAAGASIVKSDKVSYEAESAITVVMGASILLVTPAAVVIMGTSLKLDGDVEETSVLILDN